MPECPHAACHVLRAAVRYVANTTTLSLYASGVVTGVVIECGYDLTTSCAVFEGDVIPESLVRLELAGRELDSYMTRLLNSKGYRFNEMRTLDVRWRTPFPLPPPSPLPPHRPRGFFTEG